MHNFGPSCHKRRTIRVASVAAAMLAALLLGACGSNGGGNASTSPSTPAASDSATPSGSPTPTGPPTTLGDLSAINVSQDMSAQPTVTAPYPFLVNQTMTKVIVQGNGATVASASDSVQVQYVGIDAASGSTFDASWTRGTPAAFSLGQLIPGFAKGVVNQKVGSRLAIAIPSADGYGAQGQPTAGIQGGDSLLFIVDVLDAQLPGPSGTPVTPPAGLPQVADAAGVPKITIPAGLAEPTSVQVQPLIQGSGRALGASDTLTSHSVCTTWTGTEYYNDYGQPAASDSVAGGAHKALFNALVGQNVGSRVLVALPGSAAYPNGNATPSFAPNTAVACVVDLLFAPSAG